MKKCHWLVFAISILLFFLLACAPEQPTPPTVTPFSGETIPPVHIVDYALTIAEMLGFSPAPTVDGKASQHWRSHDEIHLLPSQ